MKVSIQTVEKEDLSTLIKATFPMTKMEARLIDYCQRLSFTTWIGFYDDKIVCAWGIIPPSVLSDSCYLWLHTTPAMEGHQFVLVRKSQLFIEELLREYSSVTGHVRIDAPKSQKWLKWLGAEFEPSDKAGMLSFRIRQKWQTQ